MLIIKIIITIILAAFSILIAASMIIGTKRTKANTRLATKMTKMNKNGTTNKKN